MASDLQISTREYCGACFAAAKLSRTARTFGRRMRRLREIANLSPTELADRMNLRLVDGGAIIDAEMGVSLYTAEMAKAALDVLRSGPSSSHSASCQLCRGTGWIERVPGQIFACDCKRCV